MDEKYDKESLFEQWDVFKYETIIESTGMYLIMIIFLSTLSLSFYLTKLMLYRSSRGCAIYKTKI